MNIKIEESVIKDELKFRLDREPTEQELEEFMEYLKRDIPEFITTNAKAYALGWGRPQNLEDGGNCE